MSNPLRTIMTFVCCAQAGSFSKAALELGITPQAVSSQIKELEDGVRVRLFHRTTRKINLTEEGRGFFERCKSGMDAIEDGIRSLREATDVPVGTVRLAVPFAIARGFIIPLLTTFFERYPKLSIEMIVQNNNPDVVDQGVDLGVYSGPKPPSSSMIVRKVAMAELVLCAARDYLDRYGTPATLEDLHHHRCVTLRHPRTGKIMPWIFQQEDRRVTVQIAATLTTNDTDAQRQAVLQGAGIGQLASFFVSPHVRAGHLQPLLLGYIAPPINFYLYMPRRTHIPKKTRVLADFLYDEFKRHPDFQLGFQPDNTPQLVNAR
jgi:DNA-binding transcriptional LysR family regulator